jgi:hypothetical protein
MLSCNSSKDMHEKIQGYWALEKDDNVVFIIKKNNVIYPEDEDKLKLHLNKNVMELSEEGHFITKWQVIKITSDSLFLKMEDSTLVKYVKIK